MTLYKLNIDYFEESDFNLLAIHSSLESYELAFFINKQFPVLLSLTEEPISLKSGESESVFSRYSWENESESWDLLENKAEVISGNSSSNSLFASDITQTAYLLPEQKTADFLLKITNSVNPIESIIKTLKRIKNLSTAYPLEDISLKSKYNLIF